MTKDFMISGSGKTTSEADKKISRERKDLTTKLSKGSASTQLDVVKSHYQGTYDLKGKCTSKACETHFQIESEAGWGAIQEKATEHAGHNTHYEAKFSVEQYIQLTNEQQKALKPKPTAGREASAYNPLEQLRL